MAIPTAFTCWQKSMSDSIDVDATKRVLTGDYVPIRVESHYGMVYWAIGDSIIKLTTVVAHRIGMALCKKASERAPDEFVFVKINGKEIQFEARNAKQVGGALLRKADDADDFQLQRKQP